MCKCNTCGKNIKHIFYCYHLKKKFCCLQCMEIMRRVHDNFAKSLHKQCCDYMYNCTLFQLIPDNNKKFLTDEQYWVT